MRDKGYDESAAQLLGDTVDEVDPPIIGLVLMIGEMLLIGGGGTVSACCCCFSKLQYFSLILFEYILSISTWCFKFLAFNFSLSSCFCKEMTNWDESLDFSAFCFHSSTSDRDSISSLFLSSNFAMSPALARVNA